MSDIPWLAPLEHELRLRLPFPYRWGRKQSQAWDQATNFVYDTPRFGVVQERLDALEPQVRDYGMNRWFNFWSAYGVERIFARDPQVRLAPPRNRLVDFWIRDIPFDHKTTVFPHGFEPGLAHAQAYPGELARWLFENQSQENRHHLGNRLFLVLNSRERENWKLKAELTWLKGKIDAFLQGFQPSSLLEVRLTSGEVVRASVIWADEGEIVG